MATAALLLVFLELAPASPAPGEPSVGARLVLDSQEMLEKSASDYRAGSCTSFVTDVYAKEKILWADGGDANRLYRIARRLRAIKKRGPEPGDVVFFRKTYDRNGNGRLDDGLTHVGIVETVAPDGLVTFIHASRNGLDRSRLDPRHPRLHLTRRTGEVRNDYLRMASKRWPAALSGQLFFGYASAKRLALARR
jgi:hypothetical protein